MKKKPARTKKKPARTKKKPTLAEHLSRLHVPKFRVEIPSESGRRTLYFDRITELHFPDKHSAMNIAEQLVKLFAGSSGIVSGTIVIGERIER